MKSGFQKGNKLWKKRKRWIGEGGIDSVGYHRTTKKYRRVRTHRLVMEKFLKRKLKPSECVHHINGNKLDNRLENLELISNIDHQKKHYKMRKINKYGRFLPTKKC